MMRVLQVSWPVLAYTVVVWYTDYSSGGLHAASACTLPRYNGPLQTNWDDMEKVK